MIRIPTLLLLLSTKLSASPYLYVLPCRPIPSYKSSQIRY